MIWLDCLDIPTIYAIGGTFFEGYPERIEQPKVPDHFSPSRYEGGMVRPIGDREPKMAPVGSYKWKMTLAALQGLSRFEPDAYDGFAVEFINPSTGKTANPNIAAWMQLLPAGFHSKAHRHTSSTIYQVFKGSGYSIVDGVRFDWSQGDFFVVPNWAWHEHTATEDAYLFSASDLPIMEKFELQSEESYDVGSGRQTVTGEFNPMMP
jgi:gentisate 1,2-dioxygenase